eukprot:scaffold20195_cov75-Skeletonema_dohrnii-CCMP3373.AAC.2
MMPHSKMPRLTGSNDDAEVSSDARPILSADEFACILGFLPPKQIMCLRRVCKTWREAAKKTIVPIVDFHVNSIDKYNALNVMATAMPNLQQIKISYFKRARHKYNDGEDPDEEQVARTANYSIHDIEILSNFTKLRILEFECAPMNGRYPSLFEFSLLRKLNIWFGRMKWDLEMLEGLPLLEELHVNSGGVAGNINSLKALKDTLTMVSIECSNNVNGDFPVHGDFMDLADFPHLKVLYLKNIAVKGNLLDIGEHHFPQLQSLSLPDQVYGGNGYKFQRIAEMTDFIHKVYHLKKRRSPKLLLHWTWHLSEDSPDWYRAMSYPQLPFSIELVKVGSRLGYRWFGVYVVQSENDDGPTQYCEINWLDQEPERESSEYEVYLQKLERIQRNIDFYKGYSQPPTQDEYRRRRVEFDREIFGW